MKKLILFDVLIVYTESLAVSASDISKNNKTPFTNSSTYNTVYGYFLEICKQNNLKVALTTSADIIGPGLCSSYWDFENSKWIKEDAPCFAEIIFDKFSPTRCGIKSRRKLLFSSEEIKSFNDPELFDLFFDKQRTYEDLSDYSIPSVSLEGKTMADVSNACETLTKLMGNYKDKSDFSDDIVMKDRFGAGGRHIYKFKKGQLDKMFAIVHKYSKISFIIQPFANFDKGFNFRGIPVSTDIRFIFLNGKIVQSYIRTAKSGDFRCNEHQGGSLTYLSLEEISSKLVNQAKLIAEEINKQSLYALDFIVSNNGNVYLLEGNTGPGLDWNMELSKNEIEAKILINLIIEELVVRVEISAASKEVPLVDYFPLVSQGAYPSLT
jgi:hypothetical protein